MSKQVLVPAPSLRETLPDGINCHLSFYKLLPKQTVRYDSIPLVADELGPAERFGIQVGEDLIGNVVKTFT